MAKMVYDERFGEITFAQRAAYRKFNVSQSDHDSLAQQFGEDNHAAITQAVKDYSGSGMFSVFDMWEGERGSRFQ